MRNIIVSLFVVSLLGAGCFSAPVPAPAPVPVPPTTTAPAGHPPVVSMTVGSETYPGLEGSYCYGGTCVDKIGPSALVMESGLAFKDVSRNAEAMFTVGGDIFEFGITMSDASGTDLGFRIPPSFRGGKYIVKIPNASGHVLLMANVRFGKSGGEDVQYIFPLNVR